MYFKTKLSFLFICLIGFTSIAFSSEIKFKNNLEFIKNNNISIIDTNYEYWADINSGFLGIKTNGLYFQLRDFVNDTLNYKSFGIKFLNIIDSNIYISNIQKYKSSNLILDNNDSVIYNYSDEMTNKVFYNNLYPNLNFDFSFYNENLNFTFKTIDTNSLKSVKFKFLGVDSVKYVSMSDSSLKCFVGDNKHLIIPKLRLIEIDTLFDTNYVNVNYVITSDTISINVGLLNSNKFYMLESQNLVDQEIWSESNFYIQGSEDVLNDDYLFTIVDDVKYYISKNQKYKNDYIRNLNYSTHYTFPSGKFEKLEVETFTLNNNKLNNVCLSTIDLNDTIIFQNYKIDNMGNIIILCTTNFELNNEIKSTLIDTINYGFQNYQFNNLIFNITKEGDIFSSYYLNFLDTNINNFILKDFIVDNFDYYFIGSGNFNFIDTIQISEAKLNQYIKNSTQKACIYHFDKYHNQILNKLFIGNNDSYNSYIDLNNIISVYDTSLQRKVFFISGVTNSINILDTTIWSKSDNSQDYLVFKTDMSFDSLLNVKKVGGTGNEDYLFNLSLDYKQFTKLIKSEMNEIQLWGSTSSLSNSYFETDTNVISNSKTTTDYDVFCFQSDYFLNTQKLYFLKGNQNDKLVDVQLMNQNLNILIETKSNDFLLPVGDSLNLIDTLSLNNTYNKAYFVILDKILFGYNNEVLNPYFSTYIESIDSDLVFTKNLGYDNYNYNFLIPFNCKSNNLINITNYNLNGGQNIINFDKCILGIKY